jgi:hypothetical protein
MMLLPPLNNSNLRPATHAITLDETFTETNPACLDVSWNSAYKASGSEEQNNEESY